MVNNKNVDARPKLNIIWWFSKLSSEVLDVIWTFYEFLFQVECHIKINSQIFLYNAPKVDLISQNNFISF